MKSNSKGVAVIIAAALTLAACNSNDESSKDSSKNDSLATNTTTEMTMKAKKGKASTIGTFENKGSEIKKDKMGFYTFTEVAPVFPGGQSSLESYINNNIEYPQQAIDNNVEGTVNVQFVIDESGTVSNVQAGGAKLGYGLEEEAVKIISQMPKWTPGKVKGKSVKARYTLPITYKIDES